MDFASDCSGYFNTCECLDYCSNDYENQAQNYLDAPMPWIGMYIAAASAICSLAMAADAFNGFRSKKYWLPCKYFSLNAFSLTVLAVTMKLPLDLTSKSLGGNDKLARISSLALMSTAMGNSMTSLGSMENIDIILSIAALGILVVTIVGNVCIHNVQLLNFTYMLVILPEEVICTGLMFLFFVNLCSVAMMVPSAKRYIESKYNEMHRRVSNNQVEWGKFTIEEIRIVVKRYWVMAATGSPQFVIARCAISGALGLMSLLVALVLLECYIKLCFYIKYFGQASSNYKWSINWILFIQSIGVALGTITPLFRWYVAAWFKISEISQKNLRDEFKIESYWTSVLVQWRESSLPLQVHHQKCRKLVHDAKRLALNICIGVQILFVLAGKIVLDFSAILGGDIFMCFHRIKNLKRPDSMSPNDMRAPESRTGTEQDFRPYVLLLDCEAELPEKILKNICNEVEKLIQIGEKRQPRNLINLLHKSVNFSGVREFDSNEVPSLHSQEPPNCWSLPVVTLTSIAIALPNINTDKANQLLSGVSEGLSLVKLMEKTLDRNGKVESVRNAADIVWVRLELYKKWQDNDLQSASLRGRTHRETLQKLSDIAEKTIKDSKNETEDILMQNPLNWPVKVIAANSMYRVTQTMLLAHRDDEHKTDEELFEKLSIIISDILAACLTNLVHVITLKCHRNSIKERQKSVSQAAILLGESQGILEMLQQRDIPSLDLEKAANIDEWMAFMKQVNGNPPAAVSASGNNSAIPQPNGEYVSIELEG